MRPRQPATFHGIVLLKIERFCRWIKKKDPFMPELPEVQITVNALVDSGILGLRIRHTEVLWARTIDRPSVDAFCRMLNGRRITSMDRRGKFILFRLSGDATLAVHLRMTGRFLLSRRNQALTPHIHVVIEFDNGIQLRFHDTRKFGRFYLWEGEDTVTSGLGVEPLSKTFTLPYLTRLLQSSSRTLKPLLLDQTVIAGLGNIYVDEALWMAGLHPLRRSDALNENEIVQLRHAIRHVLQLGLKNSGTTLGSGKNNFYTPVSTRGRNDMHLKVFRRSKLPCPRCGQPIERLVVAQRSSHVCAQCQPLR